MVLVARRRDGLEEVGRGLAPDFGSVRGAAGRPVDRRSLRPRRAGDPRFRLGLLVGNAGVAQPRRVRGRLDRDELMRAVRVKVNANLTPRTTSASGLVARGRGGLLLVPPLAACGGPVRHQHGGVEAYVLNARRRPARRARAVRRQRDGADAGPDADRIDGKDGVDPADMPVKPMSPRTPRPPRGCGPCSEEPGDPRRGTNQSRDVPADAAFHRDRADGRDDWQEVRRDYPSPPEPAGRAISRRANERRCRGVTTWFCPRASKAGGVEIPSRGRVGTPRAGQIWDVWSDDVEFTGTLIIALVAIEILGQLPLLARGTRALPEETRAALSRHPRHPWLAMFGLAPRLASLVTAGTTSHRRSLPCRFGGGGERTSCRPHVLSTQIRPPCASMIPLMMGSPSPPRDAWFRACQNRSKTWGRPSGAMPAARVGDPEQHLPLPRGGADGDATLGGRELERVADQILQHLEKAVRITPDIGQVIGEIEPKSSDADDASGRWPSTHSMSNWRVDTRARSTPSCPASIKVTSSRSAIRRFIASRRPDCSRSP